MADVRDNAALGRYELAAGSKLAVAYYRAQDGCRAFTHTEVPAELRGQGIASALIKGALDHARTRGLCVIPLCSFVESYIDNHPQYQDLVS